MKLKDADALVCSFCNVEGTAPMLGLSRIIEISDVIKIIEDAPTVDAVPVRRGVWYKHPANGIECSECGLFGYIDGDHEYVYNFCPRCGADMREVEKDG